MCGIFGYLGNKPEAAKIVVDGLKRLEYRGYDSWGIAVKSQSQKSDIEVVKRVGAIGTVEGVDLPESVVAIGHTRWATHGGVSEPNAHPHYSSDKSFVLAQNGMVDNFEELKAELSKKGHKFETETDTEVIVRLIEGEVSKVSNASKAPNVLEEAVRTAFLELKGRNTVIILTKEGKIIACRNGSPLVIGRSSDGDIYFSSDTHSFSDVCDSVLVVDNGQMVVAEKVESQSQSEKSKYKLDLFDIKTGKDLDFDFEKIEFGNETAEKEGHDHFMTKEIFESGEVIRTLALQDKHLYLEFANEIKMAKRVFTVGSGTAGAAAAQIAYFLRAIAKVNATSLVGADAFEYFELFGEGDLLIAPSQSGETADVLEVLEKGREKGVKIASFVNMPGSMMTKISDFKFMAGAGPEICVMSTKVFTSQIAWGYLVAKTVAGKYDDGILMLNRVADEIDKYLKEKKNLENIRVIAGSLVQKEHIFLLGKAANFQIIREGMVKIIEASYKHAHAIPAGDLKHYAITLMEKGVPVVVLVSNDEVKVDVLSAVSQVKARGASVCGIAPFEFKDFDMQIEVPDLGEVSSIFNVVVLQLLAYYMAVGLGNNVDRPRNIAKSVTVK